jgi:Fe2+ or Zn2+ uptake regulation protein
LANELLERAGLRVTAPRVTVLRILGERPHAAVDTIAHEPRLSKTRGRHGLRFQLWVDDR